MKKFIITILFFIPLIGISQNLVPNPSFETIDTCPSDQGQLIRAVPWFNPTYWTSYPLADLFNICSTPFPYGGVGIPLNPRGYQYPRTGNGYAGECVFSSDYDESRDYISVKLNNSLVAGLTYCIGFYVSLANYSDSLTNPNFGSRYAIDCLGAYLSNTAINLNTYENIPVVPQILNPVGRFLSDTLNWMLVSGTYLAQGGEQYITIGNFFTNDSTNYIRMSNSYSYGTYYYIDDVYVMDCVDTGHNGINEVKNNISITVYPNPAENNVTVLFGSANDEQYLFEMFDALGNIVFSKQFAANENTANISLDNVSKGVYICRITNANNIKLYNSKLVIIK